MEWYSDNCDFMLVTQHFIKKMVNNRLVLWELAEILIMI